MVQTGKKYFKTKRITFLHLLQQQTEKNTTDTIEAPGLKVGQVHTCSLWGPVLFMEAVRISTGEPPSTLLCPYQRELTSVKLATRMDH